MGSSGDGEEDGSREEQNKSEEGCGMFLKMNNTAE